MAIFFPHPSRCSASGIPRPTGDDWQPAAAVRALIDEEVSEGIVTACLEIIAPEAAQAEAPDEKTGAGQPGEELHPTGLQRESLARILAQHPSFPELIARIRKLLPLAENPAGRIRRELRFAILLGDLDEFNQALLRYFEAPITPNPVVTICNQPFDADWFAGLPPQIQIYALHEIYKHGVATLAPLTHLRDYLAAVADAASLPEAAMPSIHYLLAAILLLEGKLSAAAKAATPDTFGLTGWIETLRGNYRRAVELFQQDLTALRREGRRRHAFFPGLEGIFYVFAALLAGEYAHIAPLQNLASRVAKDQPHNPFLPAYRHLQAVIDAHLSPAATTGLAAVDSPDSVTRFCRSLVTYWLTGKLTTEERRHLEELADRALAAGHRWLGFEAAALAQHGATAHGEETCPSRSRERQQGGTAAEEMHSLVGAIRFEEPWQRALKALTAAVSRPLATVSEQRRLAWFLDLDDELRLRSIVPKEQKITRRGTWSRGRVIALKSVAGLPYLSEQDRRVAAAIQERPAPWGTSHTIDCQAALPALVGHPHLYTTADPNTPITLSSGKPILSIRRKGESIHIHLEPPLDDQPYRLLAEAPYRYRLVTVNRHHRRIQRVLGPDGLQVPLEAMEKVITSVRQVTDQVAILSDFPEIASTESMVADPTPHIHLYPLTGGLKVSIHVRPFGPHGPLLQPGRGPELVVDSESGSQKIARRDLDREIELLERLVAACPLLADDEELDWWFEEPEDCLQLLTDLQRLDDGVVIEWPSGERLSVSPPLALDRLTCRVRKHHQWFALEGELTIDEGLTIDLRRLLQLTARSSSRFIPLGRGQFLTLSTRLRRQLETILAYGIEKDDTMLLHPLAALALADDTGNDGAWLTGDRDWQEYLARLHAPADIPSEPPSTLQAELRPYQREGFRWLARLAEWGVGACLADDMGLGKTLQALAIILHRAPAGPTLVVAPTSVCLNWAEECRRFTPTLRVHFFSSEDRARLVADLGAFDLLITSYTLLQQEAEILTGKHWRTIVLDEAQAIKNMHTKRSQTAMQLRGDFKLITTGTPLENHLGELWNLFNFINPGLLGPIDHFNERFAVPIERHNDNQARKRLRKLIAPFVLRRVKAQVLDDLPPRTEVVLRIELSPEEAAFYEAVRREAVSRLADTTLPPGRRHFAILAEITRLRLACCNPRLVDSSTTIASSKLSEFGRLIDELLASRHKALVFSQFVGHLRLIAEYLDQRRIRYQYLDGSTPSRERIKRVNAFQAGEGDCFLISLKAGGLGLNLTAADYVILMDPWWNPAVEDQASDRAHRIGQTHPVTVYRFIAGGTIEEKIMRLHREKRELAESLLAGTDIPATISTEELLSLIRDR